MKAKKMKAKKGGNEMTETSNSIPGEKKYPETDTLCINIKPSSPLILAISQLFRDHKQSDKAIELCRLGLGYFPGDMGLRLEMAMAYLDMKEVDSAWPELLAVARELNRLGPSLEKIALYCRQEGRDNLSEWFSLLSKLLVQYPSEINPKKEEEGDSYLSDIKIILPKPSEDKGLTEEKENPDSKTLSTLTDWLTQLKTQR
jgi:hypothetical protein